MKNNLRKDLKLISELINSNEKVLDIGCGDGNLLSHLMKIKKVECRGIELSQTGVNECVKKGLSVIQGDANFDLKDSMRGHHISVFLFPLTRTDLSSKHFMDAF